jgi:hypothetical protein
MATKYKMSNGQRVLMTDAEETEVSFNLPPIRTAFDRAMEDLRIERNRLLQETDFYGASDMTMSSEMTTYRQQLRDLTNGLTTVADVEAVVFPTKP